MFLEEPIPPGQTGSLLRISNQVATPIAAGERLYSRWDYVDIIEEEAVDVIQPYVSHAGGISEMHKIATAAETHGIRVAPNCPLGPIALAASIQVVATLTNFTVQDHGFDRQTSSDTGLTDYIDKSKRFNFSDGYLDLPAGPGLGVDVNEEYVAKQAERESGWSFPQQRHPDGSVPFW
jgi:galactonate dehydratase